MSKKRQKETAISQAAYMEYLALGPERSFSRLCVVLGRPAGYGRIIEEWSRAFNWVERAKAHDAEVYAAEIAKKERERAEAKERHAEIGKNQQQNAVNQIEELIKAKAFGAIAAVNLLKLAIEVEREALDLTIVQKHELTGKDAGPIEITPVWGGGSLEDDEDENE